MPKRRSRRALIGFAMVVATLLANSLLTYLNVRRLRDHADSVEHSHEVLEQLGKVMTTLLDAETGQRGYLLTNHSDYLEPYEEAAVEAEAQIQVLGRLVQDEPLHQQPLAELQELAKWRLNVIHANLTAFKDSSDYAAVAETIKQGEGKVAMDEIRDAIDKMQGIELKNLALRRREADFSYWTAVVSGIIATALAMGLAAVGYYFVIADINLRQRAAEEMAAVNARLEALNAGLEERVRERTSAISQANTTLRAEVEVRQQAEEQARRFAEELQRSNRELEQFASVASHDLQEPLRKIQAFGDRLQSLCHSDGSEAHLDDKASDYLDRMLNSAGRMRKLIDDLLSYSRVSTRSQAFQPVSLRQVAQEVVSDLESQIQRTRGEVVLGDLPTIAADPLQMRQLLQNLISNALKFHRQDEPPRVTVSARLTQSDLPAAAESSLGLQCELSVADNGVGFEQVYADRIFELFQRLHGRDEFEGTGMGLAICRRIVERHGGTITATSAPGKGATFVVNLPVENRSGDVS
ncbi:MAG: CHASE3 domain-containing protein [Pirellulaceae bacterium]|jgi:signal transduction histidine kinase|nr:CHASE3 domain-containing protein [Pirellulaceae bacterium]